MEPVKDLTNVIDKLSELTLKNKEKKTPGGKNTNLNGKKFEDYTDCQKIITEYDKIILGKGKFSFYRIKKESSKSVIFVLQSGLKSYFLKNYNITLFRYPDEAFLLVNEKAMTLYIIEKKEQAVEGSVETKLWAAPTLKREYEIILDELKKKNLFEEINVNYIFCLSNFFKDKFNEENSKYQILQKIFIENNIKVLFGEDENYFSELQKIVNF